ncbi:Hypothetical predicted protein [Lecanosticta acicola]|uniref:Uncharacterized protein n=1 Tax=Lecanosticta acicola TaxID=111012 RepID=A0AAI8YX50_9PEZI|nr:Hypothetical predicted protein [Lecanosticta acicola]
MNSQRHDLPMDDIVRKISTILRQPIVGLTAACLAIITTQHLFVHGFHYPMLLLLAHLVVGLVLDSSLGSKHTACWNSSIWVLLYTGLITAAALVFGYQSSLHLRNTTFLVMVLSLNWDSMIYRPAPWNIPDFGFSLGTAVRHACFFVCAALLYAQEKRLAGRRDLLLLGSVLCTVLTRRAWGYGVWGVDDGANPVSRRTSAVVLGAAIPLVLFVFFTQELKDMSDFRLPAVIVRLLAVNVLAVALLLYSGDIFGQRESAYGLCLGVRDPRLRWVLCSVFLVAVIEFDNQILQPRPSKTTAGQWMAFTVSSLATLDVYSACDILGDHVKIPALTQYSDEPPDEEEEGLFEPGSEQSLQPSGREYVGGLAKAAAALSMYSALAALTFVLLLCYGTSHSQAGPTSVQSPDRNSTYDVDVVIARYEEPLAKVAEDIDAILRTQGMAGLRTRIFLYNKSDVPLVGTDQVPRFPLADEVVVEDRPNVGRESETYLSHVLDQSGDLSPHVLFLQAEPHELQELKARIDQYFVGETSFLSLSYSGDSCLDCDHCWDLGGWHGDASTIRDIFQASNPGGQQCRDLSLTYRGQFIVSARRTRQIDPRVFQSVRRRILDDDDDEEEDGGEIGYTIERVWGVIFGCPRVSSSCPSLSSGLLGNRGAVEDCQCLDGDGT